MQGPEVWLQLWTTWCFVVPPDAARIAMRYSSAGAQGHASAAAAQGFQEDGDIEDI